MAAKPVGCHHAQWTWVGMGQPLRGRGKGQEVRISIPLLSEKPRLSTGVQLPYPRQTAVHREHAHTVRLVGGSLAPAPGIAMAVILAPVAPWNGPQRGKSNHSQGWAAAPHEQLESEAWS